MPTLETSLRWARARAPELCVCAALLVWVLACKNKKQAPITVTAAEGTVTYRQIGGETWTSGTAAAPGTGSATAVAAGDSLGAATSAFARREWARATVLVDSALAAANLSPEQEAQALTTGLMAAGAAGDAERVRSYLPKSNALFALGGASPTATAALRTAIVEALFAVGDYPAAAAAGAEFRAYAEGRDGKDSELALTARHMTATAHRHAGDAKAAKAEYEAVLALAQVTFGDHVLVANAQLGIGAALIDLGKHAQAGAALEQARTLYTKLGVKDPARIGILYHLLGLAHAGSKDPAAAKTAFETADVLLDKALASASVGGPGLSRYKAENDAALAKLR